MIWIDKFFQAVSQRVFGELYHWFFSQLVFGNYIIDSILRLWFAKPVKNVLLRDITPSAG